MAAGGVVQTGPLSRQRGQRMRGCGYSVRGRTNLHGTDRKGAVNAIRIPAGHEWRQILRRSLWRSYKQVERGFDAGYGRRRLGNLWVHVDGR